MIVSNDIDTKIECKTILCIFRIYWLSVEVTYVRRCKNKNNIRVH